LGVNHGCGKTAVIHSLSKEEANSAWSIGVMEYWSVGVLEYGSDEWLI
jgi:hypothetical protein